MGYCKNVVLVFLVIIVTVSSQTGDANGVEIAAPRRLGGWTPCDIQTDPIISCTDCKTRLICKPVIGGLTIACLSPYRPYCVKGICSPIPTQECADEENTTPAETIPTEEPITTQEPTTTQKPTTSEIISPP